MKCAECSNSINEGSAVKVGADCFCNNLCRVVYQKRNGTESNRTDNSNNSGTASKLSLSDIILRFRYGVGAFVFFFAGLLLVIEPGFLIIDSAKTLSENSAAYNIFVNFMFGIPGGILLMLSGIVVFVKQVLKR